MSNWKRIAVAVALVFAGVVGGNPALITSGITSAVTALESSVQL